MIVWVALLNLFMNFCYGAMIVVLPQLNMESAGLAYSAFFLVKAAWYLVSGRADDRLGSGLGVGLSLVLQALALAAIFLLPGWPWFGRVLEGIALAQGTVSSLSVVRLVTGTPAAFAKAIGLVLGLGSLGYVVGPVAAFLLPKEDLFAFGMILSGVSLAMAMGWGVAWRRCQPPAIVAGGVPPASVWAAAMLWPIVAVACIKSVAMGLQLNLGWWARETVGLSATSAGISFVVISLLFAVGAALSARLPWWLMAMSGPVAYLLLEVALSEHGAWWWASLAFMGGWYGFSISVFYGRLGWNDSANMGRQNATWLFMADAPMAFLPLLVWPTRAELYSTERILLVGALLAISLLGYWRTFASDSRAPTRSSRA